MLTMMVGANICPEQLISIAERTIMEADTGRSKDSIVRIHFSNWSPCVEQVSLGYNPYKSQHRASTARKVEGEIVGDLLITS